MELLSFRALWRGLRGKSLTFSLVFAMALLGFSFSGILRAPLRYIGIWAPLLFILPIIATGLLARQENKLKLRDDFRRTCSYTLIFGSILLTLLLWKYADWLEERYAGSVQPGPRFEEPRELPRGPRGRH